jgi:hypothetical protein
MNEKELKFFFKVDGFKNVAKYSIGNTGFIYPIPDGEISSVEAIIKGVAFNSDGGYWKVKLPAYAKTGFGKKHIKFYFYFKGKIFITNDYFANNLYDDGYKNIEGFSEYRNMYFFRIDFNRVMFLFGDLLPIKHRHIEMLIANYIKFFRFVESKKQGSLKLFRLDSEDDEKNLLNYIENVSKIDLLDIKIRDSHIFNHQIFGKHNLYYLYDIDDYRFFLLDIGKSSYMINDDEINKYVVITSPDHLFQPITLYDHRFWLLSHRIPRNDEID